MRSYIHKQWHTPLISSIHFTTTAVLGTAWTVAYGGHCMFQHLPLSCKWHYWEKVISAYFNWTMFVIKSHLYSLQSWSSPLSHILTHSSFNFMLDIAAEIVIGRCIKGALHRFYTWSYVGSSWGMLYSLWKQSNHVLCGFLKLINEGWKCLNTELYQFGFF